MRTVPVGLLLVVFAILFANQGRADVTKLSADDRKVLGDVSRFHEISSATNLPPAIFALCADPNGRLADPGKKWEATDVITNPKLPMSRLIWAVTDGDYFVVHYERGGYAHSYHFLVARLKSGEGKPGLTWRGFGGHVRDYPGFVEALNSGKIDDDPPGAL